MSLYAVMGTIGSGKSALSELLQKKYRVQNADLIAGEVLLHHVDALIRRYGEDIAVESDGSFVLNKEMLSAILFDSETGELERRWIADLVNDEVIQIMKENARGEEVVFAEITAPAPEIMPAFEGIVLVETGVDEMLKRTESRSAGWSEERRERIYRLQKERISRCLPLVQYVFVIDNNGSAEDLRRQVDVLTEEIRKRRSETNGFAE